MRGTARAPVVTLQGIGACGLSDGRTPDEDDGSDRANEQATDQACYALGPLWRPRAIIEGIAAGLERRPARNIADERQQ